MTYLVTGAAGFIGYHLCHRLLDQGDTVLGIDSINDYYDTDLKFDRLVELGIKKESATIYGAASTGDLSNFTFLRLKLEDRDAMEKLFSTYHFDAVINLAAQAGVRYSIDNPGAYLDSNLAGFLSVLEACRHAKTPHLIYASSSSVYGLNAKRPFSVHDNADHPISLYAASKKANELMAHTYSHLYDLPTTGLRFFTVYGPWGRPDMAYFKFARAIMAGESIDVYNQGDMYRDFTYIDDIVEGLVRIISRPPQKDKSWDAERPNPSTSSAPYKLYNLGNNRAEKLGDFISTLERSLGKITEKHYLPMQAGDVYATEADIQDLERDFGWKPSTNIETGLASFARWYQAYVGKKA